MKKLVAAILFGLASASHGQDLSSIDLCSFDYNVSSSEIGFPDRVVELAPGIKQWIYSKGNKLIFKNRYLTDVISNGETIRKVDICEAGRDEQASTYSPSQVSTKPPARKKVASTPRVKKQGVLLGMNQEAVLSSSWGRPKDINRTTNRYGTREQWVYGNGNYLYFENGILTSIQN